MSEEKDFNVSSDIFSLFKKYLDPKQNPNFMELYKSLNILKELTVEKVNSFSSGKIASIRNGLDSISLSPHILKLFKTLKIMEHISPDKIKIYNSGQIAIIKKVLDKSVWIVRVDVPHKGVPYNHLNINPRYFKLDADPHVWLPPGTTTILGPIFKAAKYLGNFADIAQTASKTLILAQSAVKDYENGSTRNTAEAALKLALIKASLIATVKIGEFSLLLSYYYYLCFDQLNTISN